MLLEGKNAVVHGGGGALGGAIARAFAEEGARVFLTGRNRDKLERVASDIRAAGGVADVAVLDALDESAVDGHADAVVEAGGSLDISVNVITHGDVQGTPMIEMSLADYEQPVRTGVRTTFLTMRAAGRHVKRRGSGVVLVFGGDGDPVRGHSVGGLQVGFAALEAMRRQLAAELGRYGVRTVTLRTGGIPETLPADFPGRAELVEELAEPTLLGRAATLADVGAAAAFAASDKARTMTAATVNISCGALVD
ncbi:SDR family NAD(P)-dependent oxidoreductase [Amycolatopsis jiangsuensis]|uniref:NAD(P)-dependent dehydrogenase (Short-subunit alcohol dehydrogenase family) n=1 Tax=Amycolatopsis jiangsuensis TaxID=1181879 RepID=A0A840IVD8_9PSEU|nr:SDR family oxidoreductase [Amycolatopsis jiangsuensis]MBB4685840.1 NAD(P)-dependent dehydrogenase (short-subunit alcohol dehydrogenase family) [Amycolatopsis jiangsuensis]